jgi:hypothetical protein
MTQLGRHQDREDPLPDRRGHPGEPDVPAAPIIGILMLATCSGSRGGKA